MIAEQQSERQNNANKIQEFEEMFKKDMEDFYALDWNKEKLASLIPVLTEDHKSLTDIRNGWNERVKLIEADKATLVSLCSESEKRLVKFKQLPNNWTYNKHLPITDQIQQHKQYLKSLDIELNSLESKLAHCVTNIKGQEANMKKFLEMMKELNQQREIVSSFEDTINNCTKFRQKIILETQSLLRFRNQSCRLLFKCLELKHDDANSIKMKKDIPKDPYMIHLIEDSKLNDSFDAIPLEPVSIAALKKLLLKALILPLDTFVEHQNTFLDFWQDIHEMSSDSKTSPSNDTPKKNEGSPQVNPILRRPVNALPPTPANHPDTMFQTIFKTLMGKKDKERKNTHIIDVDSRQGSYATALENMSDHDISELQRGGDNSLFNAMLKENAKLRSQVLNVRQDMKVEKEQKYQEMESRVKHLEKLIKKIKPKLKTGKKNQAPIESSTSASSSSDVPPNHRHHHSTKTDYKNLVSVAAAVAAGVSVANGKANQIHQGHRKPAMQRQNDERIQTRSSSESFATNMVITADYPELNKLKTRVVSSSKCTSKMPIRDDSGLEISPKGSSDSLLRGNNSGIQISALIYR
ncbi:hypothetical protein BC833DRAFT_182506 [Globomyces pollinis-pini]|nr:hypothetical protein BC833DRAFT_182506 [Globomyces pollinis-pini]